MSPEPKLPRTEDGKIIAPCHRCGTNIPTSDALCQIDDDGNIISSVAIDLCSDCQADLKRRVAAEKIDAARRRAKYEKTLADLRSRVPQQKSLDMGLD